MGKTSIARIFSKALNCEKGPTVTPCNRCDACREITAGVSLDVMEIDGASNNGVEQVRALRETVGYMPARCRFKIYIIDEVHMLSAAAFNALLKTLEEPPAHVKFIFATTEPDKVLTTILSRCQRFDLRRIPVPMIVERLRQIAASEGVSVDEDALLAIARGADGALRDAESALDQLISFRGNRITEEDVLSIFGLTARAVLEELAGQVLEGNMQAVVGSVASLDAAGKDLQRLLVELMGHFRNLLVYLAAGSAQEGLDLTESQIATLESQARLTDVERTLRILDILTETEGRMRYALSRRVLLETALVRCCRAASVVTLEEILEKLGELGDTEEKGGASAGPPEAAAAVAVEAQETVAQASDTTAPEVERPAVIGTQDGGPGQVLDECALLRSRWSEIVTKVGKLALAARTLLADALPLSVTGDEVVVGVHPRAAGDIGALKAARSHKALERMLSEVLGREVRATLQISEAVTAAGEKTRTGRLAGENPAAKGGTESGGGEQTSRGQSGKGGGSAARKDWASEPAVKAALKVFGGKIVEVRE
ncbi:MAG: DNA polymerase III subunit gamma/tau [Kiritimatiellae bacterium]|nr:DNA polymerase III subunit gamma/tau [Kiritimatiellia bacterium]